jgi:hypothetical protein
MDGDGYDMSSARVNKLPMAAFTSALLNESSRLQAPDELTPRHDSV